jgi:hypothetical protein
VPLPPSRAGIEPGECTVLRGRKGTEWAMSTHAIGDRFAMLTTNLGNLPAISTDRFSESLRVRAVTAGALAANAESESFETQLARLMPYSPVHLSGVKTPFGSWTLTWVRRDRYHNDWNSGSDVPMSEETLRYDVEVYDDGGDLAESYSDLTSETVAVPSSVLGSAAPEITFSVWQKSTIVGRGFEANATIVGASGIGEWHLSTDTTYLAYIKGTIPSDLPLLPIEDYPAQVTTVTMERLRYSGFIVDTQWTYIPPITGSGSFRLAYYDDDYEGSRNNLVREWSQVHICKDDGAAGYFFVSYYTTDPVGFITRFPAVDGFTTNWSSYISGLLGPITQTSIGSGYFSSIVSIGNYVFAYYSATETVYKFLNSDLSTVTSWAKPLTTGGILFKDGSDLWLAFDDEIAKINQTSGAETLNFTVADLVADAVAVGGYVYVYLLPLGKVKKYELSTGTVQSFEYTYTDSANATLSHSRYLVADGTLLSIGRAAPNYLTGEYEGVIVVLDTTTDTLL